MSFRFYAKKVLISAVAASLMVVPPHGLLAQSVIGAYGTYGTNSAINLPKLGDAAEEDLPLSLERRVGEEIYREYLSSGELLDDTETNEYVWQVASKLTRTANANGYDFTFFVVRDSRINAFALPGGYIGINSGLLAAAQSESELASVLSHEIAHVTQRHIARMLAKQRQTSTLSLAAMLVAILAARANPNAAIGALSLGSTLQTDSILSFSRDAEREADRIGFDMLSQAGFDPAGMGAFFMRLQQANRLNESRAPEYLRTHPITQERVSDAQLRQQATRYRQRADSMEFTLVRAKMQALQDESVDGVSKARQRFEASLRDKATGNELGTWFGLAHAALTQSDFSTVEKALPEIRKRLGASGTHPMFEQLMIDAKLKANQATQALARASTARAQFPQSRSLSQSYAKSLISAEKPEEARKFLEEQTTLAKGDHVTWELLAKVYDSLGHRALAHNASAQRYTLLGSTREALNQYELAQKAGGLDFYASSQIDAKVRELRQTVLREQAERQKR
jgi:beta-barrel assembly-enhancing protease